MDITPLIAADLQVIQSYGAGRFRVSGQLYQSPVIITPARSFVWALSNDPEHIAESDFAPLYSLAEPVEILLFGAGARGVFVKPFLRAALKAKGLTIDAMDTGAACRTYNVLLSEGRRVAAALLPL